MKRRSLLYWTMLIALLLWRVPYVLAEPYREMIFTIASREGVDPALVQALIAVESAFNPRAISPKGAIGLMQLMPQTASRYGVSDPFDPQENVTAGIRYLRDLLRLFGGDLRKALAAYNAGENAVLMYRGIPPYRETSEYVQKVLARYRPAEEPPSFSSALSSGQLVGEVAEVRQEAREDFSFPAASREDGSPASSGIDSASAIRLRTVAAPRPLTEMLRAPLVQTREARTILVAIRVHHYLVPRDFPTYSNFAPVSSLRQGD